MDPDRPTVEDVERTLDLQQEDRGEIPGLYGLNVRRVPVLRVAAFQLLLAATALHNQIVFGAVDPWAFLWLVVMVEAYVLVAFWAIRRYFVRFSRFHLGTAFLVADIGMFTLAIYVMGANESRLWPIYLLRVADQMWIGRRRAGAMALLSAAAYGALLVYVVGVDGRALSAGLEFFKLFSLLGMGAYLTAAAGLPWDLQERTHEAKELILRLEEQSEELARERARAEEASMAKSEFLARMSHELRTPLNAIVGFSNTLLRRTGSEIGPKEEAFLGRIRQSGMHLLALINDILDLAQIHKGKLHTQITPVDLEAMVRDTVKQLEPRLADSPVRLSVAFPRTMGLLDADEARLRQILINLLGNAIKFTHEGFVKVEVEAHPERGAPLRLHVADSGIGIAPDRLETIFEAFEQVEGGTARSSEGTGLGLALSQALCHLMDFELTVESRVGEGSRFTVHFDPTSALDPPETTP